jgi:hypothetical protein
MPFTPHRGIAKFSQDGWAVSNMGIVQHVASTRALAILHVEQQTRQPWKLAKGYMEVWKCRVVPR